MELNLEPMMLYLCSREPILAAMLVLGIIALGLSFISLVVVDPNSGAFVITIVNIIGLVGLTGGAGAIIYKCRSRP